MVTILIPVHGGREQFIAACLDSCKKQTYKQISIIIHQDGASEELTKIIRSWIDKNPSVKVIYNINEINEGQGHARRHLIDLWNENPTRYACWTDSDDIIAPRRIERQLKLIKQGYDVVFSQIIFFEDRRQRRRDIDITSWDRNDPDTVSGNTNTATAMFNQRVGNFILTFAAINQGNYDLLFHWCILRHNCKIGYVKEPLYYCRRHPGRLVLRHGTPAWSAERPLLAKEVERITRQTT